MEDFMKLKPSSGVILLVPKSHQISLDNSFWSIWTITFNKITFDAYKFIVHSNIKLSQYFGLESWGFKHDLGAGNYGITLLLRSGETKQHFTQLVTWQEVIEAGKTGIQVWEYHHSIQNLSEPFQYRRKEKSLQSLLSVLYSKLYGDQVQCAYLLTMFYCHLSSSRITT